MGDGGSPASNAVVFTNPHEREVADLSPEQGPSLGTLRFASNPLHDPHPELSLVAYGLRRRDVLCRGYLFGGQAQ